MTYEPPYDALETPSSEPEARSRARYFQELDPFPEIPPAQLDIAHVQAYARVTGLIYPFISDDERLKPGSYEVRAKALIRWDDAGRMSYVDVVADGNYVLPANTITFALIESKIFLPNYVAIRFNLRIRHVHRGLLLGTGPLVDPGFFGDLLIPIHNLTDDNYTIQGKEGLIWIEFTKTTRKLSRTPQQVKMEEHKKDVTYLEYFRRANGNNPIRSSIPQLIKEHREKAEQASISARDAEHKVSWVSSIGILAVVGIGIGVYSHFDAVNANVEASNNLASTVMKEAAVAAADAKRSSDQVESTQKALEIANQRIRDLEQELNRQKDELRELRSRIR